MNKYEILSGIKDSLDKLSDYIDDLNVNDLDDNDYDNKDVCDNLYSIATCIDHVEEAISDSTYDDTEIVKAIGDVNTTIFDQCGAVENIPESIDNLTDTINHIWCEVEDFITVTRTDGAKINIRHADISCMIKDEDNDTEIYFNNGKVFFVNEKPEEIMELIRKAKRTPYQKYRDTLTENGVTEDEIYCYVAWHSPNLVAPFMTEDEILAKIDEVKKAKAEGFDFSLERLNAEREKQQKDDSESGVFINNLFQGSMEE